MSDWAAVVLVLGLCALAVAVYAVRALIGARTATLDAKDARDRISALEMTMGDRTTRLTRVETALRIDGASAMAAANRRALPEIMK